MVKLQKSEKGFSIIEVLIVLAIAGLIMVVVFLAVPALQRNARNNALNTNANNIYTGLSNYISNNNGKLPNQLTYTAASNTVTIGDSSVTTENQEVVDVDTSVQSAIQAIATSPTNAIQTSGHNVGTFQAVTGTGAVCNDNASGLAGTTNGSNRSIALLYVAESGGSGGKIMRCLD